MDNWPVTQAKDAFDWSNEDLEAKFIEKLKEVSEEYKRKAETVRIREKVSVTDLKEQLKKSFLKNEHLSDVQVELQTSENIFVGAEINEEVVETIEDVKESAGVGVEIEGNAPILIDLTYRNRNYKFTFVFDDTSSHSEWLKLEVVNKEDNEYKLILNTLHIFFYPFIQKKDFLVVLAKFASALVIAEISSYETAQNGKISPSSIRLIMGQVLEDFTDER